MIAPRPIVLCIGGLDPCGGAGLQADIETVASCGGHAITLCTALTAQNSAQATQVQDTSNSLLQEQFELLLSDMPVHACKIGLIPNNKIAETIADLLQQLPDIPVVLDPVGRAGNGAALSQQPLNARIQTIMKRTTLLTPNTTELMALTRSSERSKQVKELFAYGLQAILHTGAEDQTETVHNWLYMQDGAQHDFEWPRLPYSYHGSGCTLSSAVATLLARGLSITQAVQEAQSYTWRTLQQADHLGSAQSFPRRVTNPAMALVTQKYLNSE